MSGNKYIEYNHYIKEFLSDGSTCKPLSLVDRHVLSGWKLNTLVGYNAAVRKFLKFWLREQKSPFHLPASAADIYEFCGWRVERLKAADRRKSGQKHCHTTSLNPKNHRHDPGLTGIGRQLDRRVSKDQAIFDLALIAFWGLARLGEVTAGSLVPVTARDVQVLDTTPGGRATPSPQLHERKQPPIWLRGRPHLPPGPLSKPEVVSRLNGVWHSTGRVHTDAICAAGRWKSACYKLYIRPYTTAAKADSFSLLRALDSAWSDASQPTGGCGAARVANAVTPGKAVSSQNSLPSSSSILGSSVQLQNSLPSSSSILGSSVSSQNSLPSSSSILGSSISSQPSSS
ncbi:hypothetical protein PCASD_26320 [Puccinia coronata f. sp. avenae]|uniref:Core-binding (CB) domain-containing protein n=1 Tax=Puccinia coronata f. sp. avenae TaxID=200324 RepID=A0A2N5RUS0_9BASI|nr:hypothetical protein PCASD_26320 [Puccinia coronata f. sp. avenae]